MRCRPQFTLRALLVLMLAVACFFGGMVLQWRIDHHPIGAQATYESDGTGDFHFELMIEGGAK